MQQLYCTLFLGNRSPGITWALFSFAEHLQIQWFRESFCSYFSWLFWLYVTEQKITGTNVSQGDFKSTLHGKSWKINDKHLGQHMSIPENGIDSNFSIFMLFSYQVSQVILKCWNGSIILWLQTAVCDWNQCYLLFRTGDFTEPLNYPKEKTSTSGKQIKQISCRIELLLQHGLARSPNLKDSWEELKKNPKPRKPTQVWTHSAAQRVHVRTGHTKAPRSPLTEIFPEQLSIQQGPTGQHPGLLLLLPQGCSCPQSPAGHRGQLKEEQWAVSDTGGVPLPQEHEGMGRPGVPAFLKPKSSMVTQRHGKSSWEVTRSKAEILSTAVRDWKLPQKIS